eukprot:3826193-Pyramimonas_sp.AAC.2
MDSQQQYGCVRQLLKQYPQNLNIQRGLTCAICTQVSKLLFQIYIDTLGLNLRAYALRMATSFTHETLCNNLLSNLLQTAETLLRVFGLRVVLVVQYGQCAENQVLRRVGSTSSQQLRTLASQRNLAGSNPVLCHPQALLVRTSTHRLDAPNRRAFGDLRLVIGK